MEDLKLREKIASNAHDFVLLIDKSDTARQNLKDHENFEREWIKVWLRRINRRQLEVWLEIPFAAIKGICSSTQLS